LLEAEGVVRSSSSSFIFRSKAISVYSPARERLVDLPAPQLRPSSGLAQGERRIGSNLELCFTPSGEVAAALEGARMRDLECALQTDPQRQGKACGLVIYRRRWRSLGRILPPPLGRSPEEFFTPEEQQDLLERAAAATSPEEETETDEEVMIETQQPAVMDSGGYLQLSPPELPSPQPSAPNSFPSRRQKRTRMSVEAASPSIYNPFK
jgi:hypothetical protein